LSILTCLKNIFHTGEDVSTLQQSFLRLNDTEMIWDVKIMSP